MPTEMSDEEKTVVKEALRIIASRNAVLMSELHYFAETLDDGDVFKELIDETPHTGPIFSVIVGNIGTVVQDETDVTKAQAVYEEYVTQSKSGRGRAGGETVTLLVDDAIGSIHHGVNDLDDYEPKDEGLEAADAHTPEIGG